jgi:hypothetical protein
VTLRAAIMQPYLFPYLGYYQLGAAAERFVALDDVDWMIGGWINRNRLLSANGSHWFTLPVGSGFGLPIRAVEPDRRRYPFWRAKLLRSLGFDYASAPHRSAVLSLVGDAMPEALADGMSAADLALASLRAVFEHLQMPFDPLRSSALMPVEAGVGGTQRVLALCQRLGANAYLNAPGGRDLYDRSEFEAAGLDLRFVEAGEAARRAMTAPDGTPLSILHTLMHHDAESLRALLRDYVLA